MKRGWCASVEQSVFLKNIGYDFIELQLAPLFVDGAFQKEKLSKSVLPTEAFNLLFPFDMRLTGETPMIERAKDYLDKAAEILHFAKAKVVVFGSGWARNVPNNFEFKRAESQYIDSLNLIADALKDTGCICVIEPLNKKESNIVNSVDEGVHYAKILNRPEIKVLADFYHMDEEAEPYDTLKRNIEWLYHIHLADSGRKNPGSGVYPYEEFMRYLKEVKYQHRLSVECIANSESDMQQSFLFLNEAYANRP